MRGQVYMYKREGEREKTREKEKEREGRKQASQTDLCFTVMRFSTKTTEENCDIRCETIPSLSPTHPPTPID